MRPEADDLRYTLALLPGALLADRYRLVRPLGGSSAFAITYLAKDEGRGGAAAVLKEFFPRSLVGRGADRSSVRPHSPEDEQDFVRALRRFVHEGSLLAETVHPNLVRARRLLEVNGTAYLVMDHHEGQPLADFVRDAGGRLAPGHAGSLVQSLLSALEPLHADSVVHRGLSPQCVQVVADGQPILFGFSARRHVAGHNAELVPGFSAFEQYGTRDIGPWTDVYGAAALLYYLLTGSPPPAALDRAAGESVVSPGVLEPDVAPALAMAVQRGLALLPQQRPHAASEFRRQLESALAESAVPASRAKATAQAPDMAAMLAQATREAEDDRGNALRLAEGGVVVPNEEGGTARFLRRITEAASLLRRPASAPSVPSTQAVSPPAVPTRPRRAAPPAEPPAVEPARTDAVHEEPARGAPTPDKPRVVVTDDRPAPVPVPIPLLLSIESARDALPTPVRAAPVPTAALPAELDLSSEAFEKAFRPSRRRILLSAAAVLILVAGSSAALLARGGKPGAGANSPNDAPAPLTRDAAPSNAGGASPTALVPEASAAGAVLQSARPDSPVSSTTSSAADASTPATRPTTSATSPADRGTPERPASSVPMVPSLNLTIPTGTTELRMVPQDVLVDARSRLTTGEDQAEAGEYVTARRIFRTALQQLDSASARYPDSQALRALRREVELADARTLKACIAEAELHKRRGEPSGQCQ